MSQVSKQRILLMSHGHPDLNKGGAEMAAYSMFKELESRGEDVFFLARTGLEPHGGAAFSSRNSPREMLFHTTNDDWFLFSNLKTRHLWQEFRDMLLLLKPDVIHLHHYFLLGIEVLQEIRNTLPKCKIIVTLHEYLAICHNKGQMVKTSGKLCYKASSRDCSGCFPEKGPGEFFLREQYIKRMFDVVDHFISPSHFLKQRYADWGVEESRISVIENGQAPRQELPETKQSELTRFAFFGQVNPFKGIDILIEAYLMLPRSVRRNVCVDIHGANFEHQEGEYQQHVKNLLEMAGNQVRFIGGYEPHEMPGLLNKTDWVIVPSKWWENSPIVIQEALNYQVPLIVSDIGGMKEKVEDGVTGIHFRAGKSVELSEVMVSVIKDKSIRDKMSKAITPPLSITECVDLHLPYYGC